MYNKGGNIKTLYKNTKSKSIFSNILKISIALYRSFLKRKKKKKSLTNKFLCKKLSIELNKNTLRHILPLKTKCPHPD